MHQKQNKGLIHLILSLFFTISISSNALAYTLSTPVMTSNTLPSGTVTYSSRYSSGFDGFKAFDQNPNTGWAANTSSGWLSYQFPISKKITKYSINPFYILEYNPKSWTFEGYTGATWDVIDVQTNITSWVADTVKDFPVFNTNSYIKYRINVTTNNGNQFLGIGDLYFYEPDPDSTPPSVPEGVTSTIVYQDKIILDWVDNLETDFLKYRIVRDNSTLGFTTDSTFTENNLTAGNTYTYQISAIDLNGNESSPATISVVTASPELPTDYTKEAFQVGLIIACLLTYLFFETFSRSD